MKPNHLKQLCANAVKGSAFNRDSALARVGPMLAELWEAVVDGLEASRKDDGDAVDECNDRVRDVLVKLDQAQ